MLKHYAVYAVIIILFTGVLSTTYAQRPDAPTYALRGAYAVGTTEYIIDSPERLLSLAVWYPAENPDDLPETTRYLEGTLLALDGNAINNAPPAITDAPYPVVIFSHGSGGFRYQSRFLTEHLASYGFIVIAPDHPTNTLTDSLNIESFAESLPSNFIFRPQDISRVIAFFDNLIATGTDQLSPIINMHQIAAIGHSFGGYTAIAAGGVPLGFGDFASLCEANTANQLYDGACFLLDERVIPYFTDVIGTDTLPEQLITTPTDTRIQAIVALAPWNGPILDIEALNTVTTPTLILVGSADNITPPERDAYYIYDQLQNAPSTLVTFENGGHYLFVDECWETAVSFGFFESCSDPVWDMARAHDITNHLVTAFLLSEFADDVDATLALAPEQNNYIGVQIETKTP